MALRGAPQLELWGEVSQELGGEESLEPGGELSLIFQTQAKAGATKHEKPTACLPTVRHTGLAPSTTNPNPGRLSLRCAVVR